MSKWAWLEVTTPILQKMGLGSLAVFFPGLLVGCSSFYLLLSLWSSGPAILLQDTADQARRRGGVVTAAKMDLESEAVSQEGRVLDGDRACSDATYLESRGVPGGGGSYLLLVLVHSLPPAQERRDAIRDTWLLLEKEEEVGGPHHHRRGNVVGRFVVGLGGLSPRELALLACENKAHEDMLFLPRHVEPGDDLQVFSSSEKLLDSFVWAQENVDFRYVLKCTDSTFVVMDVLLQELRGRKEEEAEGGSDLLWGFFAGGMEATKLGYLAEKTWHLCTHYLPYPEGGGYVLSRGLVSILRTLADDLEHYAHDDIALGVWLTPFGGMERKHDTRFNTGHYSRGCSNQYIVTHRETAQSMRKKFSSLKRTGALCEKEFSSKPSYQYNWTVPSNRCCVRESGIP